MAAWREAFDTNTVADETFQTLLSHVGFSLHYSLDRPECLVHSHTHAQAVEITRKLVQHVPNMDNSTSDSWVRP